MENPRKVFVTNLPWEVDWPELKKNFTAAGRVLHAKVLKEGGPSGRSKGCGTVEYETEAEARAAIEMFNGRQMGNRTLFVRADLADPKQGGGGGSGHGRQHMSEGAQKRMLPSSAISGQGEEFDGMPPVAKRGRFDAYAGEELTDGYGAAAAGMMPVIPGSDFRDSMMRGGSGSMDMGGRMRGSGMMADDYGMMDNGMGSMGAARMGSMGMGGMGVSSMGNSMRMGGMMDRMGAMSGGMMDRMGGAMMGGYGDMGAMRTRTSMMDTPIDSYGSGMMTDMPTGMMGDMGSSFDRQEMTMMGGGGGRSFMGSTGMVDAGYGSASMGHKSGGAGMGVGAGMGGGGGGQVVIGKRLFVSNLSLDTTWQELKEHFASGGFRITYAQVFKEKEGQDVKCGVVELESPHDALRAISKFANSVLRGKQIFVREDKKLPGKDEFRGGAQMRGGGGGGRDGMGMGMPPISGGGGGGQMGMGMGMGMGGGQAQQQQQQRRPPPPAALPPAPIVQGVQVAVHGLPFSYEAIHLKDMMRVAGPIIKADIAKDPSGRSRGYGTVLFENGTAAQAAIDTFHGTTLHGRVITVKKDAFAQ